MKQFFPLLLLLALFNPVCSHAQQWLANDHVWTFNISGGFAGVNDLFNMHVGKDTVINGQSCKKIVISDSAINYPEDRFAYSDGDRVYAYQVYADSFMKIYDFSLLPGDTVTVSKQFSQFQYQILTADTVQAGPQSLRRQRAQYLSPNGSAQNWAFDILEGIGMVGQPFEDTLPQCSYFFLDEFPHCNSVLDGFDLKFICFKTNSGNFSPYNSDCLVLDTNVPEDLSTFRIWPNPASDLLYTDATAIRSKPLRTLIHHAQGQTLQTHQGLPEQFQLNMLMPGIYFLVIELENGRQLVRRFVKI